MTHRGKLILVLEGLASSGLQMITIRQTVPFVGSSVLSTSIIISCFLGALALGYFHGGKQSADQYTSALVRNLVLSITLFGFGLSYAFISVFFVSLSDITTGMPVMGNPLLHLTLFCLFIMAPLVYFLGQTVPLLINTTSADTRKSEASGNATALSTVGNVIGCLLTSLVLMYYLGVGYSIFINCMVLAACLLLVMDLKRLSSKMLVTYTVICLAFTFSVNVRFPGTLFAATTSFSNYHVSDVEDGRRFIINRSSASFISDSTQAGWPYIEIMKQGVFSSDMTGKDILVLGAGGFTFSAAGTHGANVTYVDIDPAIKPIAEAYFLKNRIQGQLIAYDARAFLLTNKKRWDVILVDLYTNAATIPQHTATYEFFSLVNTRLVDDGLAVLNIAANPKLNDRYSVAMDATVRQAMAGCITDITGYKDALVNIIYFCSRRDETHRTVASIYHDDKTKVTIDGYFASMKMEIFAGPTDGKKK